MRNPIAAMLISRHTALLGLSAVAVLSLLSRVPAAHASSPQCTEQASAKYTDAEWKKMGCPPRAEIAAQRPTTAAAAAEPEDSFLKKYLWDNSFDEASKASADATKQAQASTCKPGEAALCNTATATTAKVAKQQKMFADISRASDVAALGAVGGSIASEMMVKDPSQAGSLKKVEKIHTVAGAANIAAGATDVGLAAMAYFDQKKKLEAQLNNPQLLASLSPEQHKELQKKYAEAVEKTKTASLKHAGSGAAKIGAGALSLAAAKDAKKAQKALATAATQPTYIPVQPIGAVPHYQNNSPSFVVNTPSGQSILNSTPSGAISTTGGSMAPKLNKDKPSTTTGGASALAPSSGGALGGLAAPVTGTTGATKATAKRDLAAVGPQPSSSEDSTYGEGGGGLGYKGSKSSDGGLSGIVSNLLGGSDSSPNNSNAAPALPPSEAWDNSSGEDHQEEGISPENVSLFEQVHTKHLQMLAQGNLTGRAK